MNMAILFCCCSTYLYVRFWHYRITWTISTSISTAHHVYAYDFLHIDVGLSVCAFFEIYRQLHTFMSFDVFCTFHLVITSLLVCCLCSQLTGKSCLCSDLLCVEYGICNFKLYLSTEAFAFCYVLNTCSVMFVVQQPIVTCLCMV